jgi:hypothetical protein
MSLDLMAIRYRQQLYQYEKKLEMLTKRKIENVIESLPIKTKGEFLTTDQIWEDAEKVLQSNKFYALSICGPQGSGKTTIAQKLAEKSYQAGFKVVYAFPEDFMTDIDGWIERIREQPAERNCLIIDDLSYAADTQKRADQAKIKNVAARFRKVFQGEVFVIYITHRLHAAPPMLRNSGSWIFSSMQAADREDAQKVIGHTKEMRERLEALYSLISDVTVRGPKEKTITLGLGERQIQFKWGMQDDPGDGRLMAAFHAGKLGVFCSKPVENEFDLEQFRFPDKSGSAMFDLD